MLTGAYNDFTSTFILQIINKDNKQKIKDIKNKYYKSPLKIYFD